LNKEADSFWQRAVKTYETAQALINIDADSAASRAYYAAFYAVSAIFAMRDKFFSKHSALESGLHKDLIKGEGWPVKTGEDFIFLRDLRRTGDYGVIQRVSREEAEMAVDAAGRVIETIHKKHPETFPKGQNNV